LVQRSGIVVEDCVLKFPVSPLLQGAGTGSAIASREELSPLAAAALAADHGLERVGNYGNEIFYRGVKYSYDFDDVHRGLDGFLNEKRTAMGAIAYHILKFVLRVSWLAWRLGKRLETSPVAKKHL
jgi:hypothetical protein